MVTESDRASHEQGHRLVIADGHWVRQSIAWAVTPNPQESRGFSPASGPALPWYSPTHFQVVAVLGWTLTLSKSHLFHHGTGLPPRPHRGPGRRGHAAGLAKGSAATCYWQGPQRMPGLSHLELPLLWPHLDTPAGLHMLPTGLMTPEGWA